MDRETGRSRGFGFVTYTSSEEASSAIQALDGQVKSHLFCMPYLWLWIMRGSVGGSIATDSMSHSCANTLVSSAVGLTPVFNCEALEL